MMRRTFPSAPMSVSNYAMCPLFDACIELFHLRSLTCNITITPSENIMTKHFVRTARVLWTRGQTSALDSTDESRFACY